MIPFVDLTQQNAGLEHRFIEVLRTAIATGEFAGGPEVERFETAFSAYCSVEHCVALSNGTDAIRLALLAAGLGQGDEVVTPANGFFATVEAILQTGATVRFCEIDLATGLADAECFERAITERTRALVPVHLYGQMSAMDEISALSEQRDLILIEDAAQAQGATFRGRPAGSFGHAGCFSFYPTKNLGALGEGGAVITRDADLAERVAILRDHGQATKHRHETVGFNARMDAIQAGFLGAKLEMLDTWNDARRRAAESYRGLLSASPDITLLKEVDGSRGVYHLFVIRHAARDALREALGRAEIGTGVHYPIPLHRQPALAHLGPPPDLPLVEEYCATILSLPMYPGLQPSQVETVSNEVVSLSQAQIDAHR
jgi:dTDP-4-amino-4,6-dideoxygalactose transaminase